MPLRYPHTAQLLARVLRLAEFGRASAHASKPNLLPRWAEGRKSNQALHDVLVLAVPYAFTPHIICSFQTE